MSMVTGVTHLRFPVLKLPPVLDNRGCPLAPRAWRPAGFSGKPAPFKAPLSVASALRRAATAPGCPFH